MRGGNRHVVLRVVLLIILELGLLGGSSLLHGLRLDLSLRLSFSLSLGLQLFLHDLALVELLELAGVLVGVLLQFYFCFFIRI